MALKEETEKLFYTIGEVSEMFDLNASTIRFWEKEFEVLKPSKNKKGNRTFTKKDIDNIATIVNLVKLKGFTIQGAREQLKKGKSTSKNNETNEDIILRLQNIKDQLLNLKDQL
jgi:DNA-binding transcriptional MerR regulator